MFRSLFMDAKFACSETERLKKAAFLHNNPSQFFCIAQRHSLEDLAQRWSPKRRAATLPPSLANPPPREDEEIEMDSGNKSDYRRVQIDRKPSCQPPPTLGKARNNSACNEVVLKRFPAALLQLADRLYSARLCC